ncbi:MAG: polysaccharide biosynthesis tyrosine autokinase [Paludibacteraceae bacterium]|nr:polysaccharide biosynthesis tyrosine autokinase [Paludibacteraceae bacterium]
MQTEEYQIIEQEEERSFDFLKLIFECLKRWYWFVIAVFVCLVIAFFYVKKQTPKYSVTATIMIRNDQTGRSASMIQSEMMDLMGFSASKVVVDEVELLHSYGIMEQTIRALNLQTNYWKKAGLRWLGQYPTPDIAVKYPTDFLDTIARGVSMEILRKDTCYEITVEYGDVKSKHNLTSLTDPVETCAGPITFMEIHPLEPGDRMRISSSPIAPLVDSYLASVSCSQFKKESNLIVLSSRTDLPARAKDIMSKMVELYNMDAVIDKNIIASNTAQFINDRLAIITMELDEVESDVESYMKENGLTDMQEELRLALHTKSDYQKQITEYETQINMLSFIQEYLQDPKNDHSLIPANLGVSDPSLVALMKEYNDLLLNRMRIARSATSDNPLLTQSDVQLEQLRKGIITSIKNARESLEISKNDISRKDEQYNHLIRQVPAKERKYLEIKRQQEIKEKLYIYLFEKREENALTLASTIMPARVVNEPRSSSRPVAPHANLIYLIAIIFGAGIPFVVILILMYINDEIQDRKEFQSVVKAPFLGEVIINNSKKHVVVDGTSNTVSAEMFRTIRTNMKFMLPDVKCPIVLVTSSLSGEGKSYVAINTAASVALLGKKVLLMGMDIRKPVISKNLGLQFQGAITSYLIGEDVSMDELITPSGIVNGLDVAPAGLVPPNPAELIQSPRLKMLFDELRKHYDCIFVDSAPVTLVSDTIHIAPLVDMTIFVTRANYTSRELLSYIQDLYDRKNLPNMACVLNGIDVGKTYGHYRYGHYGRGYGYGYGYGTYGYGTYAHQ